jgi:hypothetical protein|tara:strand:- start:10633 stop:11562 length:930 start_codon:yes stop_codon:yes gene_type:complete
VFDFISKPLINWLNSERSARKYALSDYERICYELKPCDVVLIEGRTRVSDVIGWITQSPWTHAALYIGRIHDIEDEELSEIIRNHYDGEAGDRLVIESILGRGTLVQNLQTYETEHMRICRPSRLSLKDSKQVRRYAISRLGVDYDVRQIFDLARFLFPWFVLPRKWRSTLFKSNSGQSARTVCSTMIAEAFAYVQFPILPLVKQSEEESVQLFRRNPKLCTPSDFDYSPYFEIIKYPFVDFRHDQDYHMLPWNGSTELSDEENQLYVDPETKPDPREVEESILEAVEKSRSVPLEGEWIPADETREDP